MTAVDVSYRIDGPADAPVVVLSNSLGATRSMWDAQVPALAERFRVIGYDVRGHGESPSPPGPYTLDDLADDVVALLDEVGAERAHLVGVSLGGMTAMRLAVREPQRVDRMVLLCTSASTDPTHFRERAAAVRRGGTAPLAQAIVSRWVTPGFAAAHPEVMARLEAMVAGADDEGYAACCEVVADVELRADLPRISAPTLVVSGADDLALPPEHQRVIAEGISGAELVTLSPGAHILTVEQPLQVIGAILGHLDAAGDER
jgi:3-oxoadipate enol-lactonase